MEMQTLTPVILHELIDRIDVFAIEGTGKNRTQRIVIHYRFVGYLDTKLLKDEKKHYHLNSRQGVEIEYIPCAS